MLEGKLIVDTSNAALVERELIKISSGTDQYLDFNLTIEGYDLGRKYAHFLTRMGLWIGEYNWVWLILAGLIGALITKVLGWLF